MADPLARRSGRLLEPVQILSPEGEPAGWLVPVGLRETLLGFVQLATDMSFHRYSAFGNGRIGDGDHPTAREWLDAEAITERARELLGEDFELRKPFLSYDRNPDRLAWLVRASDRAGQEVIVFVAGSSAWIGSVGMSNSEETTG